MKVQVIWEGDWPDDIDEELTGYSIREVLKIVRKRIKSIQAEPETVLIGKMPPKIRDILAELGKLMEFVHASKGIMEIESLRRAWVEVQARCDRISGIIDEP